MSIADKITALDETLTNCKTALADKGVEGTENIKLSDVDEKIEIIEQKPKPVYFETSGYALDGFGLEKYQGDIKKAVFTDIKAPDGVKVVDCSRDRDGSIVKWIQDDTLYISTQVEGLKISMLNRETEDYYFGTSATAYAFFESLDYWNVDTSEMTSMNGMFRGTSSISELNLSSFDTSNVTSMDRMFYSSRIVELDLTSFDVSNVTSAEQMFSGSIWMIKAGDWTKNENIKSTSNLISCSRLINYNSSKKSGEMAKSIKDGGYFIPVHWYAGDCVNYLIDTYLEDGYCAVIQPTNSNWDTSGGSTHLLNVYKEDKTTKLTSGTDFTRITKSFINADLKEVILYFYKCPNDPIAYTYIKDSSSNKYSNWLMLSKEIVHKVFTYNSSSPTA